ncbi:MAG: LCP family protein [Clostridia bacterium]|nr:LCP family protein [Clostridia bacterium]
MNFKKYIKIVSMTMLILIAVFAGMYAANYSMDVHSLFNGVFVDEDAGVSKIEGGRVNVLLLATDKGGFLTDTIMVASFDKERNVVNLLSIPRDTRVKVNNRNYKINSLYGMGKEGKRQELVIEKITEITGLPINYYAVVDPDGFGDIIDILGGVEIDVPQRMYYVDPTQDLYIDLYPGLQVLDGDKAEQFCRFRSGYANADLGRIEAQQMFISELVKQKLKPKYLLKARPLFKEIQENLKTNIGLGDMTTFLPLIKLLDPECLDSYQLPGYPNMIGGASYFICDDEETAELIDTVFLGNVPEEETLEGEDGKETGKKSEE